MKRALISVSDKTNISEFGKNLGNLGYEIISTGRTSSILRDAGLNPVPIDTVTNFPECLDGRLKTLHPKIHGGILAKRSDEGHMKSMSELSIEMIDLVCVNLYDFKGTMLKDGVTLDEAIENIDIGGPAMLRSAAKNYKDVVVVCDPNDYDLIIEEIKEHGGVSDETRLWLSYKVFSHTAAYDALISSYLGKISKNEGFPEKLTLTYEKAEEMRYGENPHQSAAFYREIRKPCGLLTDYKQLHGKQLSFNNINDLQGALQLLKEFTEPAVVAVKHANPCGASIGADIYESYKKTFNADQESIYGGIIACNRDVCGKTAAEMSKTFLEIIAAQGFSEEAVEILSKKKNIRLLVIEDISAPEPVNALDLKKVSGGLLLQSVNNQLAPGELQYVTSAKPDEKTMADLMFCWRLVKHIKSNGIAIARDGVSVGLGIGQVRRSWAAEQAIAHGVEVYGAEYVKGSVMASDGFFPFPDCVELAQKAGIKAIIQPGGSKNDMASVELCDKYGIAMVFTGTRHFRH